MSHLLASMRDIQLKTAPILAGMKRAVLMDGTLYLSPAMMDLVTHAESPEELERLYRAIGIVEIPSTEGMVKTLLLEPTYAVQESRPEPIRFPFRS